MKLLDKNRPDRTYDVRTQTLPIVQQALVDEQYKRRSADGKKVTLMTIVADWLEEKANAVLDKSS